MKALVVPGSYTEDAASDALRAYKIGVLGRAAAVFGIPEVRVYPDPASGTRDDRLMATLLSYQSTAPYLRKRLFPMREELEHAGVLPPLNTPTHAVDREPAEGQVRQGLVRADGRVEVGLDEPGDLSTDPPPEGETIRVEVEAVARGRTVLREVEGPAGAFEVRRARSLESAVSGVDPAVGTSVDGEPVDALARESLAEAGIAFGPPGRGLGAILEAEGGDPDAAFDVVVNTVPGQRTATVRTEEAVWITMGLVNALEAGLG